ncbi:MAG: hypothetical protein U0T33_13600 [Bacteroidales bacterium]
MEEGVSKGHPLIFLCSFLLLLQKKGTKEKEAGKDNRFCFSPFAPGPFPLQKTETVRTFSGLPARRAQQITTLLTSKYQIVNNL